jgi:hypothetical protein
MTTDFAKTRETLSIASENIQFRDGDLRTRVIDAWRMNLIRVNANSLPAAQAQKFMEIVQLFDQANIHTSLSANELRTIAKKIISLSAELNQLAID